MVHISKLLSKELFEQPLRDYFGNHNLKVLKCESANAIPVGENYTSDILRTTITYIRENRFVLKLSFIHIRTLESILIKKNII